jgi:trimethylamine:corrinoid methyltransferase-like protein
VSLTGFRRAIAPLAVLRPEQVGEIWLASQRVLETTGLTFESPNALRILREGGCRVDEACTDSQESRGGSAGSLSVELPRAIS